MDTKNEYYRRLAELSQIMTQVLPHHQVKNPYRKLAFKVPIPDEVDPAIAIQLFDDLVHCMTLLHRMHRRKRDHAWCAQRDDVILALQLMQPLVWPSSLATGRQLRFYGLLEDFVLEEPFTVKQARDWLRKEGYKYPYQTVKYYFAKLLKMGYMVRVGGKRYTGGYQYKLLGNPRKRFKTTH